MARLNTGLNSNGNPIDYIQGAYNLRWTREKLAKLGQADASTQFDIALIGDSYTQAAARWSYPFQKAMVSKYGDAGVGWVSLSAYGGSPTYSLQNGSVRSDTNVAINGTWVPTYYGTLSPDLAQMQSTTAGDSFVVTFPAGQTSAKLYFIGSADGQITYKYGSSAAVSLGLTSGAGTLRVVALNAPALGDNSITLTVVSGTVILCGLDIRNGNNGVRVHKLAATGSTAKQWSQVTTASWNAALATIAPSLVVVMLGANDQGSSISASTFSGYMTTIIINNIRTALGQLAVDILIVMQPENQRGLSVLMSSYATIMLPIALANQCGYCDTQFVFGVNPADYAYGTARPWFASDSLHPDPSTGGRVLMDAIFRTINYR